MDLCPFCQKWHQFIEQSSENDDLDFTHNAMFKIPFVHTTMLSIPENTKKHEAASLLLEITPNSIFYLVQLAVF